MASVEWSPRMGNARWRRTVIELYVRSHFNYLTAFLWLSIWQRAVRKSEKDGAAGAKKCCSRVWKTTARIFVWQSCTHSRNFNACKNDSQPSGDGLHHKDDGHKGGSESPVAPTPAPALWAPQPPSAAAFLHPTLARYVISSHSIATPQTLYCNFNI